jgi:hypothetical protein
MISQDGKSTCSSMGPALFDMDLDDLLGQRVVPRFKFGRAFQEVDRAVRVGCAQQFGGVGVGVDELVSRGVVRSLPEVLRRARAADVRWCRQPLGVRRSARHPRQPTQG